MSDFLVLGPVLMEGFELPQSIAWGGRQRVAVHRLPGGLRVLDSMGRDDAEIAWSGVFTGPDAAARARLVDLMRADGSVWPLVWNTFFYSVVVSRFQAEFQRAGWIPYRIGCTVLRDEAEGFVMDAASLAGGIAADLGMAGSLAPGLNPAALGQGIDGAGAGLAALDTSTAPGLLAAQGATGGLAQMAVARGYAGRAAANAAMEGM